MYPVCCTHPQVDMRGGKVHNKRIHILVASHHVNVYRLDEIRLRSVHEISDLKKGKSIRVSRKLIRFA